MSRSIGNFSFSEGEVYFFNIDVGGVWVLGYIKSWIQAYLHNKLGSLQGKKEPFRYTDSVRNISLFFDKVQKDKDVFLRASVKFDDEEWKSQTLDYQEAVWLLCIVDKSIGFCDSI
jgi:hypothetical protein